MISSALQNSNIGILKVIDGLTVKQEDAYSISMGKIHRTVQRLADNFYNEKSRCIAQQCVTLFEQTNNRKLTQDFFYIAYDIEQEWLSEHKNTVILDKICNPVSYETVKHSELMSLSEYQLDTIKQKLRSLPYKEYLQTPYWKAVRYKKKQDCDNKCDRCGSTNELNVHHLDYCYVGEDHLYLDNLMVLCELHHLEWHMKHD